MEQINAQMGFNIMCGCRGARSKQKYREESAPLARYDRPKMFSILCFLDHSKVCFFLRTLPWKSGKRVKKDASKKPVTFLGGSLWSSGHTVMCHIIMLCLFPSLTFLFSSCSLLSAYISEIKCYPTDPSFVLCFLENLDYDKYKWICYRHKSDLLAAF